MMYMLFSTCTWHFYNSSGPIEYPVFKISMHPLPLCVYAYQSHYRSTQQEYRGEGSDAAWVEAWIHIPSLQCN